METNPQNSTPARAMLEAYRTDIRAGVPNIDDEYFRRFATRPVEELVRACIAMHDYDLAITFLDHAYHHKNAAGFPKDDELAKLGMDVAEVSLKEKKLDYVEWALNRAYEIYPVGSPERRQVIEMGISLVDDFAGPGGSLWFAQVILTRSLELYPESSAEYRQAVEKRAEIGRQMRAARDLGSRRNCVQVLAEAPLPRKSSGNVGVSG